jgi:hypothetical protein
MSNLSNVMDNLLDFEPVTERICKIKVKCKYYNLAVISTLTPTKEKDEAKEEFYNSLKKVCEAVPNYDMQTLLGDFNTKVGKESNLYSACGGHSCAIETDDNRKQMVNFALGRDLAVTGTWYQYKDIHKVTW